MEHQIKQTTICNSCLCLNEREADYCKNCNTSLSLFVIKDNLEFTEDHLEIIEDDSELFEDDLEFIEDEDYVEPDSIQTKPKLLELVFSWLLFFPLLILCIFMLYHQVGEFNKGYMFDLILFWVFFLLSVVLIRMLYSVTKNYIYLPNYWEQNKDD